VDHDEKDVSWQSAGGYALGALGTVILALIVYMLTQLSSLDNTQSQMKAELATLTQQVTDNHEDIKDLRADLNHLKDRQDRMYSKQQSSDGGSRKDEPEPTDPKIGSSGVGPELGRVYHHEPVSAGSN